MVSSKSRVHDENWGQKIPNKSTQGFFINASNASIISLLPDCNSVLDAGSGSGELLCYLKEKGVKAKGVDISGAVVSASKKRGLDVRQTDLDEGLPFKDSSFDCVISNQVLMHVFDPPLVISEMKRVSKEFVLVNVPNHLCWRFRFLFLFGKLPEVLRGHAAHIRLFNLSKIRSMLSAAGLEIISESYTGKQIFPSFLSTGFTFLCKKK